jgi:GNAT superfamily N-acetyltransferase
MGRYPEIDLSRIARRPARERKTKVDLSGLGTPVSGSDAAILDRLPDLLGAADLKAVIAAVVAAARARKPVLVMAGGHVVKTGCAVPLLQLVDAGVVTCLAVNGAAAIHDFEIALYGATSEDVEAELAGGTFGMADETVERMNAVTVEAHARGDGLGEALGRHLVETNAPNADRSLLAGAYRQAIPLTVHVAVGTDVLHQHPSADGAAIGATSLRDFRILAEAIRPLSGGAVLNLGSAVVMPEVFLKVLSIHLNLGETVAGLTTADFDFLRHYRPTQNVVRRPTAGGRGRGFALTGHHEILVPLLVAGVLRGLADV